MYMPFCFTNFRYKEKKNKYELCQSVLSNPGNDLEKANNSRLPILNVKLQ